MSETINDEPTAIDDAALAQLEQEYSAAEMAETAALVGDEQGPTTAEILQPVIDLACAVGCPNWQIKQAEREALAQAYGDLIDKYFPDGVGQFGVELNALLVTAAIFTPRIGQPRHKPEPDPEKQEALENAD